jgi:hypothetical protein
MDARMLVSSKYMVSESFGLGDVPKEPIVTIVKVVLADEEGDRGKEKWGLLYFAEPWAKPLKINRTHQRALLTMFNPPNDYETDRWLKKRIGLRGVAGIYFGKRQTAVRIWGSPDITTPVSFSVKKFGGGSDIYDLKPIGAAKPATPYERMWKLWLGAGLKDEGPFKELIKACTGKNLPKAMTDADVATFETALKEKLSAPSPPMTEEEIAAIEAKERGLEPEPGSAG